jgi:hypothetical protein
MNQIICLIEDMVVDLGWDAVMRKFLWSALSVGMHGSLATGLHDISNAGLIK